MFHLMKIVAHKKKFSFTYDIAAGAVVGQSPV